MGFFFFTKTKAFDKILHIIYLHDLHIRIPVQYRMFRSYRVTSIISLSTACCFIMERRCRLLGRPSALIASTGADAVVQYINFVSVSNTIYGPARASIRHFVP